MAVSIRIVSVMIVLTFLPAVGLSAQMRWQD